MASLGDLILKLGVDAKDFDKGLGRGMRKLGQFGKETKKLGKKLTTSLTLPLAAVGAGSFKLAAEFEQSMAKVKAVSGATASQFEALEQNALNLGSSTRFTASEVSGLQLEFSKLGFSADEITKVTESTLALAQATGSDLATSAEVAGATLRGFGLDASETQRVTDVMAASFSSTALDMGSFKDSMKFVAPVAKAAGISIEETTAMLGALANNGIKGSQAGTALRRIISDLGSTGGDVATSIQALANEGLNLADAKDEVGRSAQSALLILAENTGVTDELANSFNNATGTASEMAGIMDSTSEGSLAKMKSALEGAAIVIGQSLAPHIVSLANFISDIATRFTNLSSRTQNIILIIGGLAAAIGPLLVILPNLIAFIGILKTALVALTGPVGLVVAGVTALAMAFIDFGGDVDSANDSLVNIQKTAGGSIIPLEAMDTNMLRNELDALTHDLAQFANNAQEVGDLQFFSELTADQDGFTKAAERGQQRVDELKQSLIDLKASYKGNVITIKEYKKQQKEANRDIKTYENIVKTANVALEKLEQQQVASTQSVVSASSSYETLARVVPLAQIPLQQIGPIANDTGEQFKQLGESTVDMTSKLTSWVNPTIMMFEEFHNSVLTTLKGAVGGLVQGGIEAAVGAKSFAEGILSPLADLAVNLGQLAIGYGVTIKGIKKALQSLNPAAAIAAGVVLIGLGVGLKAAVNKAGEDANIPAMAEGGIVTGNTLVQVGEYAGVSSNPEVIAPLDKLKSMIGGAGGQVQVHGVIRGRDIFLTNERATREVGNLRGAI